MLVCRHLVTSLVLQEASALVEVDGVPMGGMEGDWGATEIQETLDFVEWVSVVRGNLGFALAGMKQLSHV